jgi:MFS family permease
MVAVAGGRVAGGKRPERVQQRTVRVLAGSQVLGGVGVSVGIAIASLLAADLTGSDNLSGLASTAQVLGSAVASVPVSRIMAARGRRLGLVTGYLTGAAGAIVTVTAASMGAFWLLLPGMFLFGAATTSNLQARYAAADLATPQRRGRAIATVIWATTIGAVAGPNLAEPAGRLASAAGLPALAGPFAWSALAFVLAAAVVYGLLRPDPLLTARSAAGQSVPRPAAERRSSVRGSLAVIGRHPRATLGLAALAVAQAVMVAVMVMTPVHMHHDGAQLRLVGLVISVHIAGMYALSPLVGALADLLGRVQVLLAGQAILLVAFLLAGTAAAGQGPQLAAGLFLLGLGWSAGLVTGSAMLTESVPEGERPGVQGAADLVMGLSGAACGALAGVVVQGAGYGMLNASAAVLVAGLAGFAAHTARRARRTARGLAA